MNQQAPGKTMYFYNQQQKTRNAQSAPGKSNQRRAVANDGKLEPSGNLNANLNQMMSMLCMTMLRQQGIEI